MKTIADLIARVKELDEMATIGPWKNRGWSNYTDDQEEAISTSYIEQNAKFIAEARTLLPALAEMLEECMKQRDSWVKSYTTPDGRDHTFKLMNSKLLEIAKKHGILDT